VLDDLAQVAPQWLGVQITQDWFDRYGVRFESYRLPDKKAEREALQIQIGRDGCHLLEAIYCEQTLAWLRELPSVEVMRQVWVQQYYQEQGQLYWRKQKNMPPHKQLIVSPDDTEARNRTKRKTNWTGYAVHLTEICDSRGPNLITNVETTPATTADIDVLDTIHDNLTAKNLSPCEHLVDSAYVGVEQLLRSKTKHEVDVVGPVHTGNSWQAKEGKGFDASCFAVDWERQILTCPQGKTSDVWRLHTEKSGHPYFQIRFSRADCHPCAHRTDCTRAKRGVRVVSLRPQPQYEVLQAARAVSRQTHSKTNTKTGQG